MNPLVTVGIPFLNPGRHFKDAIRSVFSQTLQDWELVLMDDGSTDGSPEIARSIRSDRIRIYVDGRRAGLPTRLNQISQLAKGTYLARMDADDLMHPHRLERQISVMESTPYGPVAAAAWMIDEKNTIIGKSRRNSDSGKEPELLSVLKTGGIIHPTLMALLTWFLDNPYATAFPRAEDRELFLRTFLKSRFYDLNENLLYYRYAGRQREESCLQGYASERKLLLKYGPRLVGKIRNSRLILRSYAKSAVLGGAALAGLSDRLMQQKYASIDQREKAAAEQDLQAALNTPVPGWND